MGGGEKVQELPGLKSVSVLLEIPQGAIYLGRGGTAEGL